MQDLLENGVVGFEDGGLRAIENSRYSCLVTCTYIFALLAIIVATPVRLC